MAGDGTKRNGSGFGFWCFLDIFYITNLTGRQVFICVNKRMGSDARTLLWIELKVSACPIGGTFFGELCLIMNSYIVLCISHSVKDKEQVR